MLDTANILEENPWYADMGSTIISLQMNLSYNLVVLMMVQRTYKQQMEKDVSSRRIILQGPHSNVLYPLHFLQPNSPSNKALSVVASSVHVVIWHRRLRGCLFRSDSATESDSATDSA